MDFYLFFTEGNWGGGSEVSFLNGCGGGGGPCAAVSAATSATDRSR